jgi:NAD(P)H-nitrite reductase large subunit
MDHQDLTICRCEEVTEAEIKEAINLGVTTINEIKRLTRAGMGLCQGKICWRLVMNLLSKETGRPPSELMPSTCRPPTRPISLEILSKKVIMDDQ